MKLILEKEEALAVIHSALWNGGLTELRYCEVVLKVSREDYKQANQELIDGGKTDTICLEDVWVQILRSGKSLQFYDGNDEEMIEFNLDKAIEELSKKDAVSLVLMATEGDDDACTGTDLLQFCLYGEVIFG